MKGILYGIARGVEGRVVGGGKEKRDKGEESDLGWEEVKRVITGLREGKAMGRDEIPNEAWKYGGEEIEKWA